MMDIKLEPMDGFFASRTEGYDEHMLHDVGGCADGYKLMSRLIYERKPASLLDIGCGTGLELDEIFKLLPDIEVTGIDLTQMMLDALRAKHPDKRMKLICGDYFTEPFGVYDAAVSFQTVHHFTHEMKLTLYRKLRASLISGGAYIECDYMCDTQEQEDFFFAEYKRLKRAQNLGGGYFHYDTPCTVVNQIKLLKAAGFSKVTQVFREENTVMLVAEK